MAKRSGINDDSTTFVAQVHCANQRTFEPLNATTFIQGVEGFQDAVDILATGIAREPALIVVFIMIEHVLFGC